MTGLDYHASSCLAGHSTASKCLSAVSGPAPAGDTHDSLRIPLPRLLLLFNHLSDTESNSLIVLSPINHQSWRVL